MRITNFTASDLISIPEKANPQSSLLDKIKRLISHLISFIQNNTSCMNLSKKDISTTEDHAPIHLSYDEIVKIIEEEKNRIEAEEKKDLTFITFLFKEPIYDVPTNNKPVLESIYEEMHGPLYDIPTNNKPVLDGPIYDILTSKPVLEEPIYEEMDGPLYDIPTNHKRVLDESIYDIPTSNKRILEEPIYEEIDESRCHSHKTINEIPPPLPPRNPQY